jgi:hypothetical protein
MHFNINIHLATQIFAFLLTTESRLEENMTFPKSENIFKNQDEWLPRERHQGPQD